MWGGRLVQIGRWPWASLTVAWSLLSSQPGLSCSLLDRGVAAVKQPDESSARPGMVAVGQPGGTARGLATGRPCRSEHGMAAVEQPAGPLALHAGWLSLAVHDMAAMRQPARAAQLGLARLGLARLCSARLRRDAVVLMPTWVRGFWGTGPTGVHSPRHAYGQTSQTISTRGPSRQECTRPS